MVDKSVVNQIISEADRYELAAKKLREAAEILEGVSSISATQHNTPNYQNQETDNSANKNPNPAERVKRKRNGKTKIRIVEEFLRHNGPKTRQEIQAANLVKPGTLRYLLVRKYFNFDESSGLWSVKDNSVSVDKKSEQNKIPRKDQIVEFLKNKGTASRKTIHAETGIPESTIARALLDYKDDFYEVDGLVYLKNGNSERKHVSIEAHSIHSHLHQ